MRSHILLYAVYPKFCKLLWWAAMAKNAMALYGPSPALAWRIGQGCKNNEGKLLVESEGVAIYNLSFQKNFIFMCRQTVESF